MIHPDVRREVMAAEARLRGATLRADAPLLEALLCEDLMFIGFNGVRLTRDDYVDLYRSGRLHVAKLETSDIEIAADGDGLVRSSRRIDAEGTGGGAPFRVSLRLTRYWRDETDGWRVVAADCHQLAIEQPAIPGPDSPAPASASGAASSS